MAKTKMRRFELTLGVYLFEGEPLPETFREWIERANLCYEGASTTTLERIVETRYPLSKDVVGKRAGSRRPWA